LRQGTGRSVCSVVPITSPSNSGFRKVIDTTFMIGTMIMAIPIRRTCANSSVALRKAQRDIDLRPELYTHYYKNEFPDRFHKAMDTRRWGPGERLVFEPYY